LHSAIASVAESAMMARSAVFLAGDCIKAYLLMEVNSNWSQKFHIRSVVVQTQ
jgi:hypothetical protein